jgi:hypothetical protein
MYWNGKCSYEIDIPQFERSQALISARALQKAALALWAPKIGALALFALASAARQACCKALKLLNKELFEDFVIVRMLIPIVWWVRTYMPKELY